MLPPKPPSGGQHLFSVQYSSRILHSLSYCVRAFKKLLFILGIYQWFWFQIHFFLRKEISSMDSSELKKKKFSLNCMFWMKKSLSVRILLEFRSSFTKFHPRYEYLELKHKQSIFTSVVKAGLPCFYSAKAKSRTRLRDWSDLIWRDRRRYDA